MFNVPGKYRKYIAYVVCSFEVSLMRCMLSVHVSTSCRTANFRYTRTQVHRSLQQTAYEIMQLRDANYNVHCVTAKHAGCKSKVRYVSWTRKYVCKYEIRRRSKHEVSIITTRGSRQNLFSSHVNEHLSALCSIPEDSKAKMPVIDDFNTSVRWEFL
jgi:hypothetical protein